MQQLDFENTFNSQSDKSYWHRYTSFYKNVFKFFPDPAVIVEFGVLNSDSIRWFRSLFPNAVIHGIDILDKKENWYVDKNIHYHKVNQSSDQEVNDIFSKLEAADLIIEDGSHIPEHQARCFAAGFRSLKSGGLYIVEDIQTSYIEILNSSKKKFIKPRGKINTLSLLLAIEHCRSIDDDSTRLIDSLSLNSYFSDADIEYFLKHINDIKIYRRTLLPKKCFNCGSSKFNYRSLQCTCGVEIYSPVDSMTCVVTKD